MDGVSCASWGVGALGQRRGVQCRDRWFLADCRAWLRVGGAHKLIMARFRLWCCDKGVLLGTLLRDTILRVFSCQKVGDVTSVRHQLHAVLNCPSPPHPINHKPLSEEEGIQS